MPDKHPAPDPSAFASPVDPAAGIGVHRAHAALRAGLPPEQYVTKAGTVLTADDLDRLAVEAEAGYDVDHLIPRPGRSDPLTDLSSAPVDPDVVFGKVAAAVEAHAEPDGSEAWRRWLALGRVLLRPDGHPSPARSALVAMLGTALHESYAAGVDACIGCAEGDRHPKPDLTDRQHLEAVLAALGDYEPPKVGKHDPPVSEQTCAPLYPKSGPVDAVADEPGSPLAAADDAWEPCAQFAAAAAAATAAGEDGVRTALFTCGHVAHAVIDGRYEGRREAGS